MLIDRYFWRSNIPACKYVEVKFDGIPVVIDSSTDNSNYGEDNSNNFSADSLHASPNTKRKIYQGVRINKYHLLEPTEHRQYTRSLTKMDDGICTSTLELQDQFISSHFQNFFVVVFMLAFLWLLGSGQYYEFISISLRLDAIPPNSPMLPISMRFDPMLFLLLAYRSFLLDAPISFLLELSTNFLLEEFTNFQLQPSPLVRIIYRIFWPLEQRLQSTWLLKMLSWGGQFWKFFYTKKPDDLFFFTWDFITRRELISAMEVQFSLLPAWQLRFMSVSMQLERRVSLELFLFLNSEELYSWLLVDFMLGQPPICFYDRSRAKTDWELMLQAKSYQRLIV